ncbi:MAG: glyoxalase [Bacteroidetes bacterium]|nr:glyoxalase [Bacteroidota bacterium]
METRDSYLLTIRPHIPSADVFENTCPDERFQNETLRPVIKLQHDLLVAAFRNYAQKHKNVFYSLTPIKKLNYIDHAIQRDIKFRNALKGMVMGMFTVAEYETYIQNSSALNKRMMQLVCERIKSSVQLLETEAA